MTAADDSLPMRFGKYDQSVVAIIELLLMINFKLSGFRYKR